MNKKDLQDIKSNLEDCLTEGQPAKVIIKIETNYKVVGNNISFYVYHISWKDKSGNHHSKAIMDSESLTAIWDDEDYE